MAYYYSINKGKNRDTALIATATNNTDVEIVVNSTNVTDKQALKVAVENLLDHIVQSNYPPV